ncbi:unnamed protein product [Diatraea saccharalis]|uniref:Uncharacterized protein n=1 Tax=Diatraea saccharalis TaxID=40085 RepID=A0A9N9R4Q6_9NEOP|nr:unnamed protein product [Diatraea saccharalis]
MGENEYPEAYRPPPKKPKKVEVDYTGKPLYCTDIHKVQTRDAKITSYYLIEYGPFYLIPRHKEVIYKLFCTDASSYETRVTVCDYEESPLVDIGVEESHLVISRQDFNRGKYLGNAVINVTQKCPLQKSKNIFYGSNPRSMESGGKINPKKLN